MGKISYMLELLRYYGITGFARKAWEKAVVDPKRFAVQNDRDGVPSFPPYRAETAEPCEAPSERPRSVYYWIHCFYPKHQGGTERFLLNLARQQRGAVRIFTLGTEKLACYPARVSNIAYREYDYLGLPVVEFRYAKTPEGLFYKRIAPDDADMKRFMEDWFLRERPDLVHCVYPQPFAGGLAACREQGVPYLVTLTDFNILCHYATMVDKRGRLCPGCDQGRRCGTVCKTGAVPDPEGRYGASAALLRDAAYVTAPSNFVARVVLQEYRDIRPIVIPHGISEEFRPEGQAAGGAVRRFAYFGTLTPMKGVHLLIQAFSLCQNEEIGLHIYGMGEPHYTQELQRLAQADRRIVFHGKVPPCDMPRCYRENDCVIVPSMWYETYNFVVREALSCGKIVLASDIGAMPEAIREHQNGLLFEAGSVDGLRQAIEDAASTNWPVQEEHFPTPENEAMRYERLYEEMSCAGT